MRGLILLLLIAMLVAAFFAFSGMLDDYPAYTTPVAVAPYEFAAYLFWTFLLLLLVAVVIGSVGRKPPAPPPHAQEEVDAEERAISGGFLLALFLAVVAGVAGVFGFGVVASAFAGLAMIVFWIAITLALVAMAMGLFERRPPPRG